MAVKELCRQNGFSDATFYKWRARPSSHHPSRYGVSVQAQSPLEVPTAQR